MSRELPFFKFNATEWITGNISYEEFEIQGAFISVCAEYWNRSNNLTIDEAKLRLRNATIVDLLIEKEYLKTKKNKIVISFLDNEREEIESKRLKLSESGRKGGLSRAKASLKQGSSIKDKDKEEEKEYTIDYQALLELLSSSFKRKFKVINDKAKRSYKARLKDGYSFEDIINAIKNCKENTYHKENNYQYCTPEFFSRAETLDKYAHRTIVTESDNILNHLKNN
jgi:uncharacterized phage protein (TIGR02220 family)